MFAWRAFRPVQRPISYNEAVTESLFSSVHAERRAAVPKGLPLVVLLSGGTDAGHTVAQLDAFLWSHSDPQEIVRFNADLLLDYRARRPLITFNEDHFAEYTPEELTLSIAHDDLDAPFLLLSGFEPDFRWDSFVDAVLLLVHEFEVSTTVWLQALPMPVPHTRPIVCTVSGSRDDLLERSVWRPTTRLPASVVHLLEYRLHHSGEDVVGFSHLVPHYLANNEYPEVLCAAIDNLIAATGLLFATDDGAERAREFHLQVDQQIAENEESREMLTNLERRFDQYMKQRGESEPLLDDSGQLLADSDEILPAADELANELERYLAEHQRGTEPGPEQGDSEGTL